MDLDASNEVDADANNVPDNWQAWVWSKGPVYRSSDRAKFGTWSVKITDSDATKDYGLQTVLMTTSQGKTYIGTGYFDGAELRLRRSFWSINNHGGDGGPGLDGWKNTFDRAAEFGVRYVRTDLVWSLFEPTEDQGWNVGYINEWKSVIKMGKTRGIELIAILQGPNPSWVPDGQMYAEFSEFCIKTGQKFGADIYYCQILNEPNFDQKVPGDFPTLASNCFDGLVQGEGGSVASHTSSFKTIVNVLANWPGWDPVLRGWLSAAGSVIDIPAIDHYPGTKDAHGCPPGDPSVWAYLDALFQIMNDYSKEGAITETGYSSCCPPWHDQDDQETWVIATCLSYGT